jgi:hypothetical protein
MTDDRTKGIEAALAAFFEPAEIRWKPQAVSGNRAAAVAYVDVRAVQQRLDDAVGVANWTTDYDVLPSGDVVCRLRVRFGEDWVQKADVGNPSQQPDDGDKLKAAFSDSLKRAAVAFGVGRYLYRLPAQWVDYDAQKRKFARPPQLPDWAVPKGKQQPRAKAEPRPEPRAEPPKQEPPSLAATITRDEATQLFQLANGRACPIARVLARYAVGGLGQLPSDHLADARRFAEGFSPDGAAFAEWLAQRDGDLVKTGKIQPGELIAAVEECGRKAGETKPVEQWGPGAVDNAIAAVRTYVSEVFRQKPATANGA